MILIKNDLFINNEDNYYSGASQQEDNDIWFDAIDWSDTREQLASTPPALSEKNIDEQIPLTEDCLRCIRQLIRQFADLKQHEYLFSALGKFIPGLPVELTLTAQSLYTAIREKKHIDQALLNSLGLISAHLLPDGNLLARLADYLKETVICYLGESYLAQFLHQDENHPGSQVFTALGLLAIVIGYRMNDVAAPQRKILQLPKFIFNFILRADYYWNKLCQMAHYAADSCVMQEKDATAYRCIREKLPPQKTLPHISERQMWTCSALPANRGRYQLKPQTRCDRQLSPEALRQMRSEGVFYAAYPFPAAPVSDSATPEKAWQPTAETQPVLPQPPYFNLPAYDPLSLLPSFLPAAAAAPVYYPDSIFHSGETRISNAPQDKHIIIKDRDGEIINLNANALHLEKGKDAIRNFYDFYTRRHPDLKTFAAETLKNALKARFNLNIDPDNSWFIHFDSGSSSDKSFTGWAHQGSPVEALTLTDMLFTNFREQDNLISVNEISGIYNTAAANRFDEHNEIRLLPSDFISLVWDLDFYNLARQETQRSFDDEKGHIKKYFTDFILGLAVSQLDNEAARDVLSGIGLVEERGIKISLLSINGYHASNAFVFENKQSGKLTLYLPGHETHFIAFNTLFDLRAWIVNNCADREHQAMLASHFDLRVRQDGIVFSGVDSWLAYFFSHPDKNEKITLQPAAVQPATFFQIYCAQMRAKALIDLDVLIKSDAEVRFEMWENYIDASSVIPNPVSPFLSLAFHLAHAFDSDSNEERQQEWKKIVSDVINFALLLLMDKMIKFNTEGYEFIDQVREGMASARSSETAVSPEVKASAAKVTDDLSDRLRRIQTQGLGGKGSKAAGKNWAEEEAGPSGLQAAADRVLSKEAYSKIWERWQNKAPVRERAARRNAAFKMLECLYSATPCQLNLSNSVVGELSSLPEVLPPHVNQLFLQGQTRLQSLPKKLPANLKVLNASGCRLTALSEKLPEGLEELILQENNLKKLPNIFPTGLKKLDISQNLLKSLPASLPENLESLIASENEISGLPKRLPPGLKTLWLSFNNIKRLPENLPDSIIFIDLNGNQLTALPGKLPASLGRLYVNSNQLNKLPDHFPQRLHILSAKDNYLELVPDSLPDSLEELYLENNRLTELPEKLPLSLKKLNVRTNALTALPDNLPPDLQELEVTNNLLTALPARLPDSLELLSASVNDIEIFPGTLPSRLKALIVSNNMLEVLPVNLPASLERIYIAYNQLHSLPEELPASLKMLDARGNQIRRLPETLLHLSPDVMIYIDENPLSRRTIEAINAFNNDPNYQGPQIFFTTAQINLSSPTPLLEEIVKYWMTGGTEIYDENSWKIIAQEEYATPFSAFLDRLAETVGAKGSDKFKEEVAGWLKQLAESPELRRKIFLLAEDATTTCEDKVALTYNEMQKATLQQEVEKGAYDNNLPELIAVGREMFRLELLEKAARAKVAKLRLTDTIEVVLAYQVQLHNVLKLNTGVTSMRYYAISGVTADDLSQTAWLVKTRENNHFRSWLAQWSPWKQALKRIDSALYNKAASELQEQLENIYPEKVSDRLAAVQLTGNEDALRIIGKQVMDEMIEESDLKLTEAFLQQRNMEYLLKKFWVIEPHP